MNNAKTAVEHWEDNAERWTRLVREGFDVYRDQHNTPAFLTFLPEVEGLAGLDIGCGEGANTRKVAELGAHMTAIDASPTFIRHCLDREKLDPRGIAFSVADARSLPFADASFDFATAFMCLMDFERPDQGVREAARVLKPGGFLQFSITHPCFAPPFRRTVRNENGRCTHIEIGRYFDTADGEVERWMFKGASDVKPFEVPRFHRTLSQWMTIIVDAGFGLAALQEPKATDADAAAYPTIEDTRVAPLFLHFRVVKP